MGYRVSVRAVAPRFFEVISRRNFVVRLRLCMIAGANVKGGFGLKSLHQAHVFANHRESDRLLDANPFSEFSFVSAWRLWREEFNAE